MFSVTSRIKSISQPRGGYVPNKLFLEKHYSDNKHVLLLGAYSSIQGMAVDYLTRFIMTKKIDAFSIAILGAKKLDEVNENNNETNRLMKLINIVKGLDDESIVAVCKIVGYDSAFRVGVETFVDVETISIPTFVVEGIRIMVERSISFLSDVGPVLKYGFDFNGGYTLLVDSGDGDYLTKNMLIDFKVSKDKINSKWSLQVLMYYLLGIHSVHKEFQTIDSLCIFNPYKNISYIVMLDDIEDRTKYLVSKNVLGYKMKYTYGSFDLYLMNKSYAHWRDVDGSSIDALREFVKENNSTDFCYSDYGNGIHNITVDDYWTYLKTIDLKNKFRVKPQFSNTNSVIMIKKNDYAMFLSVSTNGKLFIFNGASRKKATHNPQYYYDNMEKYVSAVIQRFNVYWDALKLVSDQIKSLEPSEEYLRKNYYSKYIDRCKRLNITPLTFNKWYKEEEYNYKLSGRMHGCIVDIDFQNHIYINPYDGKIVPYSARNMYDKNVYENIQTLIADKRPEYLESLSELNKKNSSSLLLKVKNSAPEIITKKKDQLTRKIVKEYSTDMYQVSNRLTVLQKVYDSKLIQVWYDELLEGSNVLTDKNEG